MYDTFRRLFERLWYNWYDLHYYWDHWYWDHWYSNSQTMMSCPIIESMSASHNRLACRIPDVWENTTGWENSVQLSRIHFAHTSEEGHVTNSIDRYINLAVRPGEPNVVGYSCGSGDTDETPCSTQGGVLMLSGMYFGPASDRPWSSLGAELKVFVDEVTCTFLQADSAVSLPGS